jgi:hypothetical protein
MRITRYVDSVSIDLELSEAVDLKAACETPEYHGPILVKIANGLAESEKDKFADSGSGLVPGTLGEELTSDMLDDALARLYGKPEPEVVVPDSEDSAHVELPDLRPSVGGEFDPNAPPVPPPNTPEINTLALLERQHGHAAEGGSVPGRYALYFFEDGSSFYIQPDGSYTERWEPETTPDAPVDVPDTDPEPDMNLPEQGYTTGIPVWDAPDSPEPPDMRDPPPPPTRKPRKA